LRIAGLDTVNGAQIAGLARHGQAGRPDVVQHLGAGQDA
jgi:hypothetical protein